MQRAILPILAAALAMLGQVPPMPKIGDEPKEDTRLPNGKLQRDEILKADFQKSLEDARELAKLSDDLKTELEKSDRNVLSLSMLKKTEDIEKLARRLRDRMKH